VSSRVPILAQNLHTIILAQNLHTIILAQNLHTIILACLLHTIILACLLHTRIHGTELAYYNIGMLIAYPYRWHTIITKTNCRLFPVNLYQYIGQTPNTLRSHQIASQVICHQYSGVDTRQMPMIFAHPLSMLEPHIPPDERSLTS